MTLDMTWVAFSAVILAALALGVIVQVYFAPKTAYEWLITAIGASVGAWFVSELTWSNANLAFGPTWEGLLVVPAVIAGVVIGGLAEAAARVLETTATPA